MPRSAISVPRQRVRDFGTCLNFAGGATTDNVAFSDAASLDFINSLTITAWINPRSFGAASTARIVSKTSGANNEYGFFLNGATKSLRCFLGTTDITGTSNIIPVLGIWYFVALTFNKDLGSNQVKFYVNGVESGTGTKASGIGVNSESLYIGNTSNLIRSFDGKIDEVKIYNRALSAGEILDSFYGNVVSDTGLVLHTTFNEGSGVIAIDSSGTQADGTITGATYSTDVFIKPRTVPTLANSTSPSARNLFTNPTLETNSSGWRLDSGFTRSSENAYSGSYSIKAATSSGFSNVSYSNGLNVKRYTNYTFSVWTIMSVTGNPIQIQINSGSEFGSSITTLNLTACATWTRRSVTFNSGNNVQVWIRGFNNNGAVSGYLDAYQLEEGSTATEYLDGSLGDGYSWAGTAHLSVSSRLSRGVASTRTAV